MSDPTSTHKVAAVTDGMGGIGQGIVIALPQRDFDVVVCDRTIDPAIAERMTTNAPPGAHLSFVKNELVDPADLPRFVYAIFAAFGHIECLVNNAGISAKSRGDLLDVSAESYDLNFTVNTRGAFFLTQAVCKKMLAAEGEFPESARSVYSYPPRTPSSQPGARGVRYSCRHDKLLEQGFTPFNRWGTPEDVGRAVATMAAGELPFTTGAAIRVDGGIHIHQY